MKNKLGLDTILILVAIIIVAILLILALANKGEYVEENATGASNAGSTFDQLTDKDVFNFNARLSGYEGNQTGRNLSALINAVETSNANNDRQVTINGSEDIEEEASYNVSMSKDSEGYISVINIEKK